MTTTQDNWLEEILFQFVEEVDWYGEYTDGKAQFIKDYSSETTEAIAKINSHILETALELIGEDETGFNKYGSFCTREQHIEIEHYNELRAELRQAFKDKYEER